ncbi:MAG: SRPBCC domain-containing protein [Saprospiraceae bacterium]|nr:SRPBCC domain-containing protein [Saprospiraceae bacterium]
MEGKTIGKTKDQGWQIGVRKTLPVAPDHLWEFLVEPSRLAIWLSPSTDHEASRLWSGQAVVFASGVQAVVRTIRPYSHFRLLYQRPQDPRPTRLQVRIIPASHGSSTLAFHQELLQDAAHRALMKLHWLQVIQRIEAALTQ